MIEVILSLCFDISRCICYLSYSMHMQFIATFCFNYLIIIVYFFADIDTYVRDDPLQQDEKMEEVAKQLVGHRPIIPHRPNHRVHTKLKDRLCDLFVREGVAPTYVREITQDLDMFTIW